MSYFITAYGAEAFLVENLNQSFLSSLPEYLKNEILHLATQKTSLSVYGVSKTIKDFFYQDKDSKSWIAILGTTLFQLPEKEKPSFLSNFFRAPSSIIRQHLDGCWCLLAYDADTDRFYAATDYDNTIPIFYSVTDRGVFLSSHELPLARFLQSPVDPLGLSLTVQLKLTWGELSRFQNIRKLLPAQLVTFHKTKKIADEQYWQPVTEKQWTVKFDEAVRLFIDLLKRAVTSFYELADEKQVLCDITGGEDSRLILSVVHNLGIPFSGIVDGQSDDIDVVIARKLSSVGQFSLRVRPIPKITENFLLEKALEVSLFFEAYEDYFASCTAYGLNLRDPFINYNHIKFCGAPGGEVFRGSYYLRGKAFFPSISKRFDYKFFTKMKFLLDYFPELFNLSDEEIKQEIFYKIKKSLSEVEDFPTGIKIDHLIRVFQTCNTGLIYKLPRYLPLATRDLTRLIYQLPPKFKKGGKLTRAATEVLFPEISYVKTQKGIPTVKKTLCRSYLFYPEYITLLKSLYNGAISRWLKWKDSNKPELNWSRNSSLLKVLFSQPPYCKWFSSAQSMISGPFYNKKVLDHLLLEAKEKPTKHLSTLGRIISQELALRWVYREY